MSTLLPLHELHAELGGRFAEVNSHEIVEDYGNPDAEYTALTRTAGVVDLSFRGRLCLTGADRVRLLHGQVTNDVQKLQTGDGCYAALVTNKGKFQSDAHIYALAEELLLDFEPGLTAAILGRLDHYIVADDVQMVDVAPHYGLLSVQGPRAAEVLHKLGLNLTLPTKPLGLIHVPDAALGDLYFVHHERAGSDGYDCFIPTAAAAMVFDKLVLGARLVGGGAGGFAALELARFEAGIPRFGVDMDETNLPPEAGIDTRAISYTKGCYIGQEVIARIRTYGQVAKALRRLRLPAPPAVLPVKGDKLFRDGRDVGYVTSARFSPAQQANLAMAYVRREANTPGTPLTLHTAGGELAVEVLPLQP